MSVSLYVIEFCLKFLPDFYVQNDNTVDRIYEIGSF